MAPTTLGIVQPMVQRELMIFYSKSKADEKKIECVINALKKYKKAIEAATKNLEKDLKKCQIPPVKVKKPIPKK